MAMTSILFHVLYLAIPTSLTMLALAGCRSTKEEAFEPIKILHARRRRAAVTAVCGLMGMNRRL